MIEIPFSVGDIVRVSRPQQQGYKPWLGRVFYDDHNKGLAVESLEKGPVLTGKDTGLPAGSLCGVPVFHGEGCLRLSIERDFRSGKTLWELVPGGQG